MERDTFSRTSLDTGPSVTVSIKNSSEPNLGILLRTLREQQGLEGKEVALRLGVTPAAVTHWEHGRRKPQDFGSFMRLLEILNVSPDERAELLTLAGYPPHDHQEFSAPTERLVWTQRKLARIADLHSKIASLQGELSAQINDLQNVNREELFHRPMDTSLHLGQPNHTRKN